jgi:acyl-CoA dehydrogenase
MACDVVDRAMQAFGAEGICQDQELARMYAGLRTLRFADVSFTAVSRAAGTNGIRYRVRTRSARCLRPLRRALTFVSQVHIQQIGKRELKRAPALTKRYEEVKKREEAMMSKYGLKARL